MAKKQGMAVENVASPSSTGSIPTIRGSRSRCSTKKRKELSLDDFLDDVPEKALVIILDHIEDPQNLGAIWRSADAFGASLVVAPTRRASP